jgi:hypothetical protein
VGEGFVFSAVAVRAKRGCSFAYTMQIRVDRIDTLHTLQPYSIFGRLAALDILGYNCSLFSVKEVGDEYCTSQFHGS